MSAGFVEIRKRDGLREKVAQRSISRPAIVLRGLTLHVIEHGQASGPLCDKSGNVPKSPLPPIGSMFGKLILVVRIAGAAARIINQFINNWTLLKG
jgi:hypothetical protein